MKMMDWMMWVEHHGPGIAFAVFTLTLAGVVFAGAGLLWLYAAALLRDQSHRFLLGRKEREQEWLEDVSNRAKRLNG